MPKHNKLIKFISNLQNFKKLVINHILQLLDGEINIYNKNIIH